MATQLQLAKLRAANRVTLSPEEEAARKNAEQFLAACREGNIEKATDLLSKGLSPDTCDAAGTTGMCL